MPTVPPASPNPRPTFHEALRFWMKLGFISFGGPAGQIAIMHEKLVERRRWISEERFLHALNFCMLLPGPEAQQLATYIGWLLHGTRGGLVAGTLFVLPSAVILWALSYAYVTFGTLPVAAWLLGGLKLAVLAIGRCRGGADWREGGEKRDDGGVGGRGVWRDLLSERGLRLSCGRRRPRRWVDFCGACRCSRSGCGWVGSTRFLRGCVFQQGCRCDLRRRVCGAAVCGAAGGRELRLVGAGARCSTGWAWPRRRRGR